MKAIIDEILKATKSQEWRDKATSLLVEICKIDTTPASDVTIMRDAEAKVFDILERELAKVKLGKTRCERRKIDPAIAKHPAYSQLHFTKTEDCPEGLSPEEVYAERVNLLFFADGKKGRGNGVAVNSHIDVVKPYFPPRVEDGIVFGRGSCDDKGSVVSTIVALQILGDVLSRFGKSLSRDVIGMFVVEEETGGNGSLSLALDKSLSDLYSSLLVLECCGNDIHPANRGAVWYQARLEAHDRNANMLELASFVYEQLEQEGRSIKSESRHGLFPQRPVQTCHGIIGPYGEHPSRICGEVAFDIVLTGSRSGRVRELIDDAIAFALADYVALYGDKTKVMDGTSGKPKVARHFDLEEAPFGYTCRVHGSTGHMGSIMENDGAITKMACFVRGLYRSKDKIAQASGGQVILRLHDVDESSRTLNLEGGQGFVPTHEIDEVMERIRGAASAGVAHYLSMQGLPLDAAAIEVGYDKLHNDAFDGDPDSPQMRRTIQAAKDVGIWKDHPIMGWTVSCDARLFAKIRPDMPVITSGAGQLQYAHGDAEQLKLDDLMSSVAFVAVYLLREAGLFEE